MHARLYVTCGSWPNDPASYDTQPRHDHHSRTDTDRDVAPLRLRVRWRHRGADWHNRVRRLHHARSHHHDRRQYQHMPMRLSMDLQKGIISRFRTIAGSAFIGPERAGPRRRSLSCPRFGGGVHRWVSLGCGMAGWLWFAGILVLFTLAMTWMAMFFGLLARTVEGAGAFVILLLLIFISPSFVPTDSMTPLLRGFCRTPADDSDHRDDALTIECLLGIDVWGTRGSSAS